jgi:PAS domain-containing protein
MKKRSISNLPVDRNWSVFRITGIYLVIGLLWILLSDSLAVALAPNPATLTWINMLKGWFYVIATAFLIASLVRREINTLRDAEQALSQSETSFRSIVEQVSDVLYVSNLEGVITFISPSALQMFGCRAD